MNRYICSTILILLSFSLLESQTIHRFNENRKSKVVIIINNGSDKGKKAIEFISDNSNRINYEVEILETTDDGDFSKLKEFLRDDMVGLPLYTLYIDHNPRLEPDVSFSYKKYRVPLEVIEYFSNKKDIGIKNSYSSLLYITGIKKEMAPSTILGRSGSPGVILKGGHDLKMVFNDLLNLTIDEVSIYYSFPLFNRVIYLKENLLVTSFLIFIGILGLLTSIYSKRIMFHIKRNRIYIHTLAFKGVAIFAFFFISTLVLDQVAYIAGDSEILYNYPKSFFIIKLLIIYFIYGICFHVIKDTNFSKSPYFYSYIAFFLSILIYLLLTLLYIPIGLIQIAPIISIIFFISSRHRSSKRFFLVLTPLMFFIIFYRYLLPSNREFINLFLASKYKGNIILTTLILPYLFLQDSYHRFITRRQNKVIYRVDIISSFLVLLVTVTYIAVIIELNK